MAVVPMQKVKLLVHQSDTDAALAEIQKAGAVQFQETTTEEVELPVMEFVFANLLPRTEHVVNFLKPYQKKNGLLKTLREGTQTELTEAAAAKIMTETEAIESMVSDIEKLQVEFAEKTDSVRTLTERQSLLSKWKNLPFKLSELETKHTVTKLVELDQAVKPENSLANQLATKLSGVSFAFAITDVAPCLVALTLPKSISAVEVTPILDELDAAFVDLAGGVETPEIELTAVSEKLAAAKGELALAHDQAEYFANSHLRNLQIAAEIFGWSKERHVVLQTAASTKRTLLFTGWLNVNKRLQIESAFAEQKIAAVFTDIEPSEDEQPPVDIVNNKWIQPFEMVTRLYGMPGYKDLDPTLFLAGFFFLFFGLSLTDVGYGLALVAASLFILLYCKVSSGMKVLAKLLLYIGIATVLVGMLFGGYLGFDPALLPGWVQAIQMFDPIGDPLPVFYLALGLGVFQVMVGMILKIYSEARNGALVEGVLDQGPWLLMFFIGIAYVAVSTGYVSIISTDILGNLAIVAAVLIVLAGGRHKGSVIQKAISSLAGLYAGVGYFSDILSYSRLLALGLATSALAYAVNLIASMVSGVPYVGFILAAAILIVGHLFTLAINTLGAFVHSARLQFVEFFGKFIAGTGKEFSPLTRKSEYVTVRDD